jgi:hypothetical protein
LYLLKAGVTLALRPSEASIDVWSGLKARKPGVMTDESAVRVATSMSSELRSPYSSSPSASSIPSDIRRPSWETKWQP